MTEFAKRRKELIKKTGSNSIVILVAAPAVARNHYHEYPYRQNSDFYYLTGFTEPEAVAVLAPGHKNGEFILFNRVRDRDKEIWEGYRAGQKGAIEIYGADAAYPISELPQRLPDLLEEYEKIHYPLGKDHHFDKIIINAVNQLRAKIRNGIHSPLEFNDIEPTLHEMRLIKSEKEIELMRKAGEISAGAHIRAMQFCEPGINEYQLEAEVMYEFQRNGARFCAYTPIIGSGENSCILHYNNNNKVIQNGEIILIDAGCEYEYYASDVTRSFPANGRFSAEQKAIYEIVLAAQLAGIEKVKPGTPWPDIQKTIVNIITQGLLNVGLLKGNLNDLIETQAYLPFYMHKSGHWLGLDTHDAGRYKINGKWRELEKGMVTTVEPGIYISADIEGVDPKWHNIGIRIEDDVVVTENGYEVLSHKAPKSITEIEALMSQ